MHIHMDMVGESAAQQLKKLRNPSEAIVSVYHSYVMH